MTKISTISVRGIFLFPTNVGLAVLLAAILASTTPSRAVTATGGTATCFAVSPNPNPNFTRFQCIFPPLASTQTLHIQYVSMQCESVATSFLLQLFQVITAPPNSSSEVSYQIPITYQSSLGNFVVSAGSPVELFAKAGSQPRAVIDLTPVPVTPVTTCTVSVSGVLE